LTRRFPPVDTRRFLPYLVAAVGGFGLAWVIVYSFIFPPGGPPVMAVIPNVLGLTYDHAAIQLKTAGFSAGRGVARYNVSAPRSTVLAQAPAAGASEPKGSVVVLDVSAGQRRATIPNVVGLLRTEAESTLASVGLDVSNVTQQVTSRPRGTVLSTSPPAGTSMILPSGVNIAVSLGPDTATAHDSTTSPDATMKSKP
jgi:eukaryotic-like serine/threonine-protein kinase